MAVSNDSELLSLMQGIVEEVINNVAEQIIVELRLVILRDVYNSHGFNKIYKSTYEFLAAFHFDDIKKSMKEVSRKLFYDWESMVSDPATYTHSSVSPKWPQDSREMLAEYLDKEGPSSSLWISVNRHAFFKNFVREMFDGGKLTQIFDKEFSKRKIYRI